MFVQKPSKNTQVSFATHPFSKQDEGVHSKVVLSRVGQLAHVHL